MATAAFAGGRKARGRSARGAWTSCLCLWLGSARAQMGSMAQQIPYQCNEFATCSSAKGADWGRFRELLQQAVQQEATNPQASMEIYFQLVQSHALDAGVALECRMGAATAFYRLGRQYMQLGYAQRAANLYQLAMSMFWDTSRQPGGMECLQLELWGVRWFDDYMETYLGHAARLQRNSLSMLPHPKHWQVPSSYRDQSLRIAVFSLCDYAPDHKMHWLQARSKQNRQAYCARHGYGVEWTSQRPPSSMNRHPVWGQIAGPLELLEEAEGRYDWILSMDCDSLFVNHEVTIDSVLYRFAGRETPWGKLELDPEVHFLISEDGRGLAGGNWIVRNNPRGREFLREVYGPDSEAENPYMRHDLRDQFSLLWHLVRPGVSLPMPTELPSSSGAPQPPRQWADVGYLPGVRLVPQDFLLGSYPHVSCSQPGDHAHRCFQGRRTAPPEHAGDFIVSVPLLGSIPENMAQAILDRFLLEGLGSLGQPAYEQELRALCPEPDVSRCLMGGEQR